MANYESIINNVYHYIWTQLNQLDVFLASDPDNKILRATWEAYWNVLAHLDADAAADRAKSYGLRDQFTAKTESQNLSVKFGEISVKEN